MELYDVELVYSNLTKADVEKFTRAEEAYAIDIFTNPIGEGECRKLSVTRENDGFILNSVGGHISIANIKLKDGQWNEYVAGDFVLNGASSKIVIRSNSLEKKV